jgi:hypothetical protein
LFDGILSLVLAKLSPVRSIDSIVIDRVFHPTRTLAMNEDESSRDLADLARERIAETERLLEEIRRKGEVARADDDSPLAEVPCDPFELMKQDVSLVLTFLDDPDPAQRKTALHVAMLYWKGDESLQSRIMKAAKDDVDVEVRTGAAQAMWAFHRVNPSRSLQTFLASIVRDETEEHEVRKAAYYTLLLTMDRAQHTGPLSIRLRFPEDVDWSLVDDYRE